MATPAITLPSELTFATVPGLLGGADALARSGPLLDLSAVQRIDSAGVSFLLELLRRARAGGQRLAFANLSPQARGLIGFLGLEDLLLAPAGSLSPA